MATAAVVLLAASVRMCSNPFKGRRKPLRGRERARYHHQLVACPPSSRRRHPRSLASDLRPPDCRYGRRRRHLRSLCRSRDPRVLPRSESLEEEEIEPRGGGGGRCSSSKRNKLVPHGGRLCSRFSLQCHGRLHPRDRTAGYPRGHQARTWATNRSAQVESLS